MSPIYPSLVRETVPHLTEGQRRELLALIANHPTATCPEIAQLFEARTGRSLSKVSVRRAWVRGYKPAGPPGKEVAGC